MVNFKSLKTRIQILFCRRDGDIISHENLVEFYSWIWGANKNKKNHVLLSFIGIPLTSSRAGVVAISIKDLKVFYFFQDSKWDWQCRWGLVIRNYLTFEMFLLCNSIISLNFFIKII